MAKRSIPHVGSEAGIASDLIGGADFQRIKITLGAEGVDNGDLSASNALPVSGTITAITDPVAVTGTFWQTTQPVSGTVSVSGTVAVSGTFWQATQPVSIASAVAVTGTFFQATQPVSAASLPLPSGASTSAAQTTGNTSLSSIDGKITACNTGAVVLAAGSAAVGTVLDGGSGKTIKSSAISLTSTGTVISAVPTKRIKVFAIKLICSAALAVNWRDGATTALEGIQSIAINGGYTESVNPPNFLFGTTAGNSLDLVITGVGTAAGRISYWDSDDT